MLKKATYSWTFVLAFWVLILMLSGGCKKDAKNDQPDPELTTIPPTNLTQTSATSGGTITSQGIGDVTARGVCWSSSQIPIISDSHTEDGSGTGTFTSNLRELKPNTRYYLRAYAKNVSGIGYGDLVSFTTNGTIKDFDGNVYNTIGIGTQVWMVENLRTTRYNDGVSIPLVTDSLAWANFKTPGYCWYNNNAASYKILYGALYNWYAVNTGKLAPAGWHIPTEEDWSILADYLGGEAVAGGKMKSTGTLIDSTGLWFGPNTGATNSSLFTALPGGFRYYNGYYYSVSQYAFFWSSTESDATHGWTHYLFYNKDYLGKYGNFKTIGFSVRCIQD